MKWSGLCTVLLLSTSLAHDDGGWTTDEKDIIGEEGPCNIERHDGNELTQREFEMRYAYSEPVIIYNVDNAKFAEKTKRVRMLDEWSSTEVVLNSANTYSYTRVPSSFSQYIDNVLAPQNKESLGNDTLYLFGDMDRHVWDPLLTSYSLPKWTLPDHSPALSFGIAGAGTGVPFHFHGPGFAEVIHGAKRWFLYPFEDRPEFDPDRTTLEWYTSDYTKLPRDKRPLECLLRPVNGHGPRKSLMTMFRRGHLLSGQMVACYAKHEDVRLY